MTLRIGKSERDLTGGTEDSELARLRQQLIIDKDSLDDAVIRQAVLYDEVADRYTQLCSERDEAKSNLEATTERLSLNVRQQFSGGGDGKRNRGITVDEVNARVGMKSEYKRAEREYLDLVKRAAVWGTLKDSFHQRRYMLQELCGLYASQYWTKSSMTKGGAVGERIASHVRSQLRRRI